MADAEEALNSITTDTSAKSRSLYPDGCGVPLLQRVQDEDIIQQLRLARYRCPPGGTAAFTLRLYENQRWSALRREWGAQHLFSTERGALTHGDGIGSYRLVPRAEVRHHSPGARVLPELVPHVVPPPGWSWRVGGGAHQQQQQQQQQDGPGRLEEEEDWRVMSDPRLVDADGWGYAAVWGLDFTREGGVTQFVRRRIWQRTMVFNDAGGAEGGGGRSVTASPHDSDLEAAVQRPRSNVLVLYLGEEVSSAEALQVVVQAWTDHPSAVGGADRTAWTAEFVGPNAVELRGVAPGGKSAPLLARCKAGRHSTRGNLLLLEYDEFAVREVAQKAAKVAKGVLVAAAVVAIVALAVVGAENRDSRSGGGGHYHRHSNSNYIFMGDSYRYGSSSRYRHQSVDMDESTRAERARIFALLFSTLERTLRNTGWLRRPVSDDPLCLDATALPLNTPCERVVAAGGSTLFYFIVPSAESATEQQEGDGGAANGGAQSVCGPQKPLPTAAAAPPMPAPPDAAAPPPPVAEAGGRATRSEQRTAAASVETGGAAAQQLGALSINAGFASGELECWPSLEGSRSWKTAVEALHPPQPHVLIDLVSESADEPNSASCMAVRLVAQRGDRGAPTSSHDWFASAGRRHGDLISNDAYRLTLGGAAAHGGARAGELWYLRVWNRERKQRVRLRLCATVADEAEMARQSGSGGAAKSLDGGKGSGGGAVFGAGVGATAWGSINDSAVEDEGGSAAAMGDEEPWTIVDGGSTARPSAPQPVDAPSPAPATAPSAAALSLPHVPPPHTAHASTRNLVQEEGAPAVAPVPTLAADTSGAPSTDEAEDAPDAFVCPISAELMLDPVVAADGHSYSRSAIAEWIRRQGARALSPMTGQPLPHRQLTPNHHLKSMVLEWQEGHQRQLS